MRRVATADEGSTRGLPMPTSLRKCDGYQGVVLFAVGLLIGCVESEIQDVPNHDGVEVELVQLKYGEARYHDLQGRALADRQLHAEAVVEFDRALVVNSGYLPAYIGKATSLESLGKYADAVECYDRVLAHIPDHREAVEGRERAIRVQGRDG